MSYSLLFDDAHSLFQLLLSISYLSSTKHLTISVLYHASTNYATKTEYRSELLSCNIIAGRFVSEPSTARIDKH